MNEEERHTLIHVLGEIAYVQGALKGLNETDRDWVDEERVKEHIADNEERLAFARDKLSEFLKDN